MKKLAFIILIISFSSLLAQDYKVGDHELILMPTAYTMPITNSYFTDAQVLLLNFTYAVTPSTHVGVFSFFPFRKDFYESITVGIKQNYVRAENIQSAVYLTYTVDEKLFILGNVISLGVPSNGLHVSAAYLTSAEVENDVLIWGLGYRIDPYENTSLILEYSNGKKTDHGKLTGGLLSLAYRIRSEYLSWEIGGMHIFDNNNDWLLYPLLKATYYFH